MEDVESRFMHFLQPIRDLTKNWEVDVAAQLSEYLEELDQICISFDGGKTTMNFIEAALLIQGSACIYSKKVEYLYSLVYQALDFISNKKREKLPASVREDGADKDVSARSTAEEEGFLSLNDVQDTSRANKELRDNQQPMSDSVVPLTPMPLVPPEEADKTDNLLYSQKGELLASRKDFRINVCTPYHTGTFLLELAGLLSLRGQPGRNPAWGSGSSMGAPNLVPAAGSTPMEVSLCTTPVLALNFSEGGDADTPPGDEAFAWDVPQEPPEVAPAGVAEHMAPQAGRPQRKGYVLRERAPALDAATRLEEAHDPWRSLDPFSSSEDKPLRTGRPFMVPRGLEDLPGTKRKRRLSSRLQEFSAWFSATEHSRAGSQRGRKKGPTFADLDALYWRHVRERLGAWRTQPGRACLLLAQPPEEPGGPEEDREENFLEDADGGGADDALEHEALPPPEAPEELPEDHTAAAEVPPSLNYEELVQRKVELFMTHSQKYARQTMLSQHVQDWEERMGPQLEEQEARAAFDIHDYGDRLGSRLGRVGEWRSFASLVAGQPPFEVCRSMLACLQLANDYTVEISQQPGLEEAVDTMALRLLTREKAHERFRTYTAPSLAQP